MAHHPKYSYQLPVNSITGVVCYGGPSVLLKFHLIETSFLCISVWAGLYPVLGPPFYNVARKAFSDAVEQEHLLTFAFSVP